MDLQNHSSNILTKDMIEKADTTLERIKLRNNNIIITK